ncbi:MAG: hypothetical protein WAV05_11080, partial [Anaerolineales bacterium]
MNYSFWIKWSLAITVIALIHSFTLTISPTVWPDEVDIIDYGRVALQPNTEWSINWQEEDRPRLMLSYLGPILQEWAFQFSGESLVGPRAISLIGALAAATIAVGWLRSRGTSAFKAGLLGLIFLLDPLFTQSYRGARVDGWAMALGLGACWVLSRTSWRIQNGRTYHGMVLLAGALDLLAFFVWPSAVMLFPLA